MAKTAILYRSPHHGNTKKLLDAIVRKNPDVVLLKAGEDTLDPTQYEVLGFASGVYAGHLHRTVRHALHALRGGGKKAFIIYTCGDMEGEKYGRRYTEVLEKYGFESCGFYWCVGHDSFGPLRIVGGIHKGRPDQQDLDGAVAFYENLN